MQQATVITSTWTPSRNRALLLAAQQGRESFGKVEGVSIGDQNEAGTGLSKRRRIQEIKMLLPKSRLVLPFKVINTSNVEEIPTSTSNCKPQCSLETSAGCPNAEGRCPEGKPKPTLLQNSILGCRTASAHKGIRSRRKGSSSLPDRAPPMGENRREAPTELPSSLNLAHLPNKRP